MPLASLSCPTQTTASSEILLRCPECPEPRYYKGSRGLNIHIAKKHRSHTQLSSTVLSQPNVPAPSQSPDHTSSNVPFHQILSNLKNSRPVLKRIPRGARVSVAKSLSHTIKTVLSDNSICNWELLLTFTFKVLHINSDENSKSLTKVVKDNCCSDISFQPSFQTSRNTNSCLFKRVESKISDGDIKGAARLLFSDDAVAPYNSDTLTALHSKHPPPPTNLCLPDPPLPSDPNLIATTQDILGAVMSFPNGSAGGLDGLTPQHLKDLLCSGCGESGEMLLKDLTALVNIMLAGQVPDGIKDVLYGANLCALIKKDGGIRPIAVGSTLRRLAAKIACRSILLKYPELQPVQLGFGSKSGCEAAVHAVRTFLEHKAGEVLLKVDVCNAFNSVDRGALLTQIKDKIPLVYKFLWQCYSSPSKLSYKNEVLASSVGCQQGDPLGPAIFSLAIHPIIKDLNSKLNVWYLDDGTLGGEAISVLEDLRKINIDMEKIGLSLNFSKCELFITDSCPDKENTIDLFRQIAPGIKIINKESLHLLGCPVLDQSFENFVDAKIQNFKATSHRLAKINLHSAYSIIKHCLLSQNLHIYFAEPIFGNIPL
ncbi:LOW QUALITY PROTEIN: uncharacterized protein [Choristoneura fumiferana]|uniref:LOW QUALITY PROTEIN: uncharacterized protein n=1 Tax=Choristoneura fumiferana TaxID=7141 RepID=UPI003D15D946